jgi:hypothetical protein
MFSSGDSAELRAKAHKALGYCSAEGSGVSVDEDSARVRLASNASPSGAVMLLENVTVEHADILDPNLAEEARRDVVFGDDLPFVYGKSF